MRERKRNSRQVGRPGGLCRRPFWCIGPGESRCHAGCPAGVAPVAAIFRCEAFSFALTRAGETFSRGPFATGQAPAGKTLIVAVATAPLNPPIALVVDSWTLKLPLESNPALGVNFRPAAP